MRSSTQHSRAVWDRDFMGMCPWGFIKPQGVTVAPRICWVWLLVSFILSTPTVTCDISQQHTPTLTYTHTHTHSPCSKTWLFYLIFLREISVSLASSNFSLFITHTKKNPPRKKHQRYAAQMCLSKRMPSPSRFPLFLPPSFYFLPLFYLCFFPSSLACKLVPSYHKSGPMKHWESLRKCCCAISQYLLSWFQHKQTWLHCSHTWRYMLVFI